LNDKIPQNFTV